VCHRSQGVCIELPEHRHSESRCFEFQISPHSTLYVLGSGLPLYAINIRIKSCRTNLQIEDFEIVPAWEDDIVACTTEEDLYRFRGGLEFERKDVLNERIESSLHFRRPGEHVEGWLLGCGFRPVPPEYGPYHRAPFELYFVDQLDDGHPCQGTAEVHRFRRVQAPKRVGSLFKGTDWVSETTERDHAEFMLPTNSQSENFTTNTLRNSLESRIERGS
jgi:hypothetical protein